MLCQPEKDLCQLYEDRNIPRQRRYFMNSSNRNSSFSYRKSFTSFRNIGTSSPATGPRRYFINSSSRNISYSYRKSFTSFWYISASSREQLFLLEE